MPVWQLRPQSRENTASGERKRTQDNAITPEHAKATLAAKRGQNRATSVSLPLFLAIAMREVLFPRLIKLRADDALAHGLAEVARRDGMTLSEFARRELRSAVAVRARLGRPDDDGPGRHALVAGARIAA